MNKITIGVIITFFSTTLLWSFILSYISDKSIKEIEQLKTSYEEDIGVMSKQVSDLECDLKDKDNTIELLQLKVDKLKRKVKIINTTYEEKLEKSELIKYHLESSVLSDKQLEVADEIAHIVASNYEKYGVLPSVAVGQAMQESQLGVVCPENNLWGISTGNYSSYPSLEVGVLEYLKVINNGLYDGALFNKSYDSSLISIQSGGYCVPSDGYASTVSKCISNYGFSEYDSYYLGVDLE